MVKVLTVDQDGIGNTIDILDWYHPTSIHVWTKNLHWLGLPNQVETWFINTRI